MIFEDDIKEICDRVAITPMDEDTPFLGLIVAYKQFIELTDKEVEDAFNNHYNLLESNLKLIRDFGWGNSHIEIAREACKSYIIDMVEANLSKIVADMLEMNGYPQDIANDIDLITSPKEVRIMVQG